MIREYFDKYNKYDPNEWVWQPYVYAHNCSIEEQNEWNERYTKYRARKGESDKKMPDFYSIERDANQFGLEEVTFTDIFGLKWSGKKGRDVTVGAPDFEGHLYYWDSEYEEYCVSDEYTSESNQPDPSVFYMFNVGYPRWRKEWIDIANITDIEYHYVVENHLFKDTYISYSYEDGTEERFYDSFNYNEVVKAFKKFGKTDLLNKLFSQMNEHFEKLRTSEREDERQFYPGCTAEEFLARS